MIATLVPQKQIVAVRGSDGLYTRVRAAADDHGGEAGDARLERFHLRAQNPFTNQDERFDYPNGAVAISKRKPPLLAPPPTASRPKPS